ncbi:MAG: right-handed parallel beta-helix repeat-containing protein [Promethearchaeota archaeon]
MHKLLIQKNTQIKRLVLVSCFSFLMLFSIFTTNIPGARADFGDWTYSIAIGNTYIYRISSNSEPISYEKYQIISKVEGDPSNFSIYASYENYSVATSTTTNLANVSFSSLCALYGEYKEGGSYSNGEWTKTTITIMDQDLSCWTTTDEYGWSAWISTVDGVEVKKAYNENEWVMELVSTTDEDLAIFAQNDIANQPDSPISIMGSLSEAGDILTGSGTNTDPYVIENLRIGLQETCSPHQYENDRHVGIEIDTQNSEDKSYLVIRNVIIQNQHDGGIIVKNVQNVTIQNVSISNNCFGKGIEIHSVKSVNLFSNSLINNAWYGARVSADFVNIRDNVIQSTRIIDQGDDTGSGLVVHAKAGIIENNQINYNLGYGIFVSQNPSHLEICNNQLCDNTAGPNGGWIFQSGSDTSGIWFHDNDCGEDVGQNFTSSNTDTDIGSPFDDLPGYSLGWIGVIGIIVLAVILRQSNRRRHSFENL